ncbi:MAG TPA: hypothetical protein VK775_11470 [Chthoniobacterales bacterium]|jgi:hypothetical protein|nr:hypothetical protein [Chthoniobacterales bacterium]
MAKKNYYLSGVLSPSEKPGIRQVILAILTRSSELPSTVVTSSRPSFRRLGQENQGKHIVDIGADISVSRMTWRILKLSLQGDKANA